MTNKVKPLHVLSLQVENLLRVSAVYIEPSGKLIEITGRNRQGKSSTLTALWLAVGGEKAVPADPIHDNESEGFVIVNLGDRDGVSLKVTKRIKRREDGSFATSLIVENAEGHRLAKPQEILNALVGQYTADPLDFLRAKPREQFDVMKAFVPGVDFAAIDAANASDFAKRTDVNRRAKELRAQAAGIAVPQPAPIGRIDETALVDEMQRAGEHNAEIERQKSRRQTAANLKASYLQTSAEKEARADALRKEADAVDAEAVAAFAAAEKAQADIDAMPPLAEPIDASAVKAKIEQARAANAAFDKMERQQDIIADAEIAEAESAELTSVMARREADKKAAVAAAKMPVDGITFGDGMILHNGHPLENASGAQQLRIAVEVAAALNPRVRFVRVRDASLLDADSWNELAALCEELDLQVFAETVQSGRSGAVVIEDGMVVGTVRHMEAAE